MFADLIWSRLAMSLAMFDDRRVARSSWEAHGGRKIRRTGVQWDVNV